MPLCPHSSVIHPENILMNNCFRFKQKKMPKNTDDQVYTKKVVAVGDMGCGKTSFLMHSASGSFPTLGAPSVCVNQQAHAGSTSLVMVDTHHQEEYERLRPLVYVDADVILLCFSVDSPDSLWNIKDKWIEEVSHYCPRVPTILVGCKRDLRKDDRTIRELRLAGQDLVMVEEAEGMASRIGATKYMECSAITGEGIAEVLEHAAHLASNKWERRCGRGCVIM